MIPPAEHLANSCMLGLVEIHAGRRSSDTKQCVTGRDVICIFAERKRVAEERETKARDIKDTADKVAEEAKAAEEPAAEVQSDAPQPGDEAPVEDEAPAEGVLAPDTSDPEVRRAMVP